ncbi:restriction endonuclease subunit S [Chryseobacterium sp. LC2016-27]|uniref:restriction endonuclease subunit S n=1 Tax=Chryseobacterium sp. LC2016-27 TaxID=2897326 RepID=UPI001E3BAAA3|nr:restriction endonuclease subunit S [Chryseobacterium sp. LC2016-27]MCD0455736.1 restriction endonuclease subunit S [Chryseobacterium sp. LC2016-27]
MQLKNIANLQFGFYDKPKTKGNVCYLQAKHFNEFGLFNGKVDEWIDVTDKSKNHLLEDGDVLLVGKGMRNFAWRYKADIGKAIASSIFFVIKPKLELVDADYLITIFNSSKYQSFFQSLGAGSSIPSIRKNELEAVDIPLPPLLVQKKIARLNELHQKELRLTRKLIEEKNKLFQAVINDIL